MAKAPDGANTRQSITDQEALLFHSRGRPGKLEISPTKPMATQRDLSLAYSPGVAVPVLAIAKDPSTAYDYTTRGNMVAVITNGTAILGLGNLGALAAKPVMEGKAVLFKRFADVDSIDLEVNTEDPEEFINAVKFLGPSFGGINLEDIAQPKCFEVLDTLREKAEIPIWHDDQQGTATVILAGLLNALKVVGKKIGDVGITFVGSGASNSSAARLIFALGADPGRCMVADSRGILGKQRRDVEAVKELFAAKWKLCQITNRENRQGGTAEAMKGMDVVIACSTPGPGTIKPEWVAGMKPDSIVFSCANPVPEIWPWEAKEAGAAIFATGRSDFPNQVNNSLCFPGLFRGALDVRARTITDEMCFAAAESLAGQVGDKLDAEHLLPTMDDWEIFPREAAAVGMKAQEQGVARVKKTYDELFDNAMRMISRSREMTRVMMRRGFIPKAPGKQAGKQS